MLLVLADAFVDPKLIIHGNQSQLEMVVLNLINNAIDSLSTYEGKRTIVFSTTQIGSKILLTIEDSGAGVPLELGEQIFDLFRTNKNEGMGFGLWLSRAVMENHRGSLTLDNDYSDGARFVIEFRTKP